MATSSRTNLRPGSAAATHLRYVRPWMYPKQKAAVFAPERYSVIEATTKSGKTVGCMIWLAEQAMAGKAGQNYWWVAPVFPQAKIAFRRLKHGLPDNVFHANETELTITLANGAVIWFKTGEKPDNLYGEDVYAAVIDEATRVREEAWYALRSTLTATRGPLRIIGNVKGRKNWAYKMARRAEDGEPDMAYFKITWRDAVAAGILDFAEIEDARRQLPPAVFQELYEAEPSDDEGNPFGILAIQNCVTGLSSQPPEVWAWDLARSTDWTVGIALDRYGQVCGFERWNQSALPANMAGTYWEATINRIREVSANVASLVESNGLGDPVFEAIAKGRGNFAAFFTSSTSKQQIMEGLAVAIQQRAVGFPDGHIRRELEEFEYQYTRTGVRYSAPEGLHDDCVMALAMAWALHDAPTLGGTVTYDDRVRISPV